MLGAVGTTTANIVVDGEPDEYTDQPIMADPGSGIKCGYKEKFGHPYQQHAAMSMLKIDKLTSCWQPMIQKHQKTLLCCLKIQHRQPRKRDLANRSA